MNKTEMIEWIRSQLGWPMVKVELTDQQIEYNLRKAKQEYVKWGGGTQELTFSMMLSAGQTEYELPTGVTEIINMQDASAGNIGKINTLFTTGNILYNLGLLDFLKGYGRGFNLLDFHLSLQWMDIIDKYIPSRYSWNYYKFANILEIQPPPPSGEFITLEDGSIIESPGFILLHAFAISEYGISKDKEGEFEEWLWDTPWIQDYCLALCKMNLGYIRRKFSNFQSIGNTGIQLDGSDLIQEGQQEKETLEERLRNEEQEIGGIISIG